MHHMKAGQSRSARRGEARGIGLASAPNSFMIIGTRGGAVGRIGSHAPIGRLDLVTPTLKKHTQCLKITEKVTFNNASEASYVYNLKVDES